MEKNFPEKFMSRMLEILGNDEYEDFLKALVAEPPASIRLNPEKISKEKIKYNLEGSVPWCKDGYYLQSRPIFTLDPLLHGGAYYVQEASSMFISWLMSALKLPSGMRVLDMCAAPGGKSTLLASLLPEDALLVANEVVKSRLGTLKENIIKWGTGNCVVTSSEAGDFAALGPSFDLILVDAPCSGEGMFRKDAVAVGEWSENNLRICEQRQKNIVRDVWKSLKPGGYMIYSTCTFNPGEDMGVLSYAVDELGADSIDMHVPFEGIKKFAAPYGYLFMPHRIKGEGFFAGVLQKKSGTDSSCVSPKQQSGRRPGKTAAIQIPEMLSRLVMNFQKYDVYNCGGIFGVLPARHHKFIDRISEVLKVQYKGCELLQRIGRKNRPLPPAAFFSDLNKGNIYVAEVDRIKALHFLKREDIEVQAPEGEWVLVAYEGVGLGWGKKLSSRLNNNYPKNWMIRMKIN